VSEASGPDRRIMAVILTHNAPESLDRCLHAIASQSTAPDAVLVLDNASHPAVTSESLSIASIPVEVVRSEVNTGPAGGYHDALAHFLGSDFLHAWVLDDDMRPHEHCLERLWAAASEELERAFEFPALREADGAYRTWPSWCGFLVARQVIEAVGLPMSELFWWAEDTEYLQWRIPDAGYERRQIWGALVEHDGVRQGDGVPMWKYYYEARNMLYVNLHVKRRLGHYPRNVSKFLARALLREKDNRLTRVGVIAHGLFDGATGRLGIRYPVEPMSERTNLDGNQSEP
jgi:rhamnopyranosyl-N-acetylglucosaminyl-diphospho-decaprenol beta-1,3/1,4-galactofuranosyltransferase